MVLFVVDLISTKQSKFSYAANENDDNVSKLDLGKIGIKKKPHCFRTEDV